MRGRDAEGSPGVSVERGVDKNPVVKIERRLRRRRAVFGASIAVAINVPSEDLTAETNRDYRQGQNTNRVTLHHRFPLVECIFETEGGPFRRNGPKTLSERRCS